MVAFFFLGIRQLVLVATDDEVRGSYGADANCTARRRMVATAAGPWMHDSETAVDPWHVTIRLSVTYGSRWETV